MKLPQTLAALAAAALLTPGALHAQHGAPIGDVAYDSVFFAWEAGDYPDALRRLDRLLAGPDASRYLNAAAELTGEVFITTELAPDGRLVRWSPDSRHAAFEVGTGAQRRTHVYGFDGGGARQVVVLDATGVTFDDSGRAAYVAGTAGTVTVRDLASGREVQLAAPGLTVQSIMFRPGDASVYVLAPTGAGASDVYRLGAGAPERVTRGPGTKTNPVWLSGDRLLYGIDRQLFAVEDLRAGATRRISGSGAAASADGSTIVWVEQDGGASVLRVLRADDAAPRTVLRSSDALSNPALSRDGSRIVYQRMPREDWELYVVNTDGSGEQRLTREIQHDVLPRFLDDNTVFALMGEARHRRSFLYDVGTGTRTRFFHNNTVRTVSPEYEWAVSPDGTKVLIVADRDGDTVSPERGVYVTELTRRATLDDVRSRVRAQLAHELDLRARGARLFAGLEDRVRAAVADVSKDRAYRYSYDLYQFDSKHITQPGNLQAIEYLVSTLRQWGYEPELQWFEPRPRATAGTPQPAPVRTANVIAKLPGTVHPDVLYVVSSHFDSVERGPGADDNTSGTAALLEAARVLATRPQPATIHFAFFTGEESGLLGSREYVRRAVERGDKLVGALNNDMIGFANDQRLDNTIRYSNDGIRDIQHAAAFLFTDLITYDAKYYRSTDAHAYYEAYGDIVGGIGSYPILGNPHYHQTHDQLETITHQLVAEVAKTTVATLMQLTNVPSRPANVQVTRRGAALEVRWDALPEQDISEYIVEFGPVGAPARGTVRAREPRAVLQGVVAGEEVRVSAVNTRGAPAWDRARIHIEP
jgi:DNA-binding beta-propeller fold protein YncE